YDLSKDGLKIHTTIDSRLQKMAEDAVVEKMKALQKKFASVWGKENPWRTSDGKEIIDFPQKAAQRLPIFKLLEKKYKNNPDSVWVYFNTPKKMKVFSWSGERDTVFSPIDSIKYYAH